MTGSYISNMPNSTECSIEVYAPTCEEAAKNYDFGLFLDYLFQEIRFQNEYGTIVDKEISVVKQLLGKSLRKTTILSKEKQFFQRSANAIAFEDQFHKIVLALAMLATLTFVAVTLFSTMDFSSGASTSLAFCGAGIFSFIGVNICNSIRLNSQNKTALKQSSGFIRQNNWANSVLCSFPSRRLQFMPNYPCTFPNATQLKSYGNELIEIAKTAVYSTLNKVNKAVLVLFADDQLDHNGANYMFSSPKAKFSSLLGNLKLLEKDHAIKIIRFKDMESLSRSLDAFTQENEQAKFKHVWLTGHASGSIFALGKNDYLQSDNESIKNFARIVGKHLDKRALFIIGGCEAGACLGNGRRNISQEIHHEITELWRKRYPDKSALFDVELSSISYNQNIPGGDWYRLQREQSFFTISADSMADAFEEETQTVIPVEYISEKTKNGFLCVTRYSGLNNQTKSFYTEKVTIDL